MNKKQRGVKYDQGKIKLDLLSTIAMFRTARVMTVGLNDHEANNWRKGFNWTRIIAALMRHLTMWSNGMDKDPDTGLSNLDHASCMLMFLQEMEETGTGIDDRYKIDPKILHRLYPPKKKEYVKKARTRRSSNRPTTKRNKRTKIS